MLLTEKKKGVSQNDQTPNIIGICSTMAVNADKKQDKYLGTKYKALLESLPSQHNFIN